MSHLATWQPITTAPEAKDGTQAMIRREGHRYAIRARREPLGQRGTVSAGMWPHLWRIDHIGKPFSPKASKRLRELLDVNQTGESE